MSGLSFTGKVVLVTGASSTVGSDLAKYFSKLGASLVLTDCDKYRLNKVGEECSGSPVLKIAADLTKYEDITSVIKQTIAEFKKLDILINYVSPTEICTADDLTPLDAFKFMMNVSVCSVHCVTLLAYPHLVKTRGNVVNVHDLLSHLASDVLSRNVCRSALDELTKSLASHFSCAGVRVNAVSAGSIENRLENHGKSNESIGLRTHLGPEDIAAAVVFLASDLATFITGANIPVDGGKHLTSSKECLEKPAEKNQERPAKVAAKSDVPKSEQSQPASHKKEQSRVDASTAEHSKQDSQKDEQPKQSSVKHDARKSDVDKSTTAKHLSSEKIGKPATKNNN